MIAQSIFIVGAGSSKEYDYPLWKELKPLIENSLESAVKSGDKYSITATEWLQEVTDEKSLDQVISEKNGAIKQEIDPSKVEAVIWTAIADIFFGLEKAIIDKEKLGWIDIYSTNISQKIVSAYGAKDDDWDSKIADELKSQLGNTYFITFNYDRILEHKIIGGITDKIKADVNNENKFQLQLRSKLYDIFYDRIYHPHGIINPYSDVKDNSKVDLKNRNSSNIVYFGQGTKHILQFSPGLMASCFDCEEGKGSFSDIYNLNHAPKEIYILGNSVYGLKNNLKKLPCKKWTGTVERIVCTSYIDDDQEQYQKIINEAFGKDLKIVFYKTCTDFINTEV